MNIKTARVVIVGAGASGLQCANRLVTQYGYHPKDIIILEARDRIGGRIHTTLEERCTVATSTTTILPPITTAADNAIVDVNDNKEDRNQNQPINNKDDSIRKFSLDHGAAWVHGTGIDWGRSLTDYDKMSRPLPNPMIELLYKVITKSTTVATIASSTSNTTCSSNDDNESNGSDTNKHHNDDQNAINSSNNINNDELLLYTKYLHNTVSGNPWIRPDSILHQTNSIQIYIDGIPIDNNKSVLQDALQQHYTLFREVSNYGNQLYSNGCGIDTIHISLQEAIHHVNRNQPELEEQLLNNPIMNDNDNVISDDYNNIKNHNDHTIALVAFYQHLLECWNGSSASDLQLCAFIDNINNNCNDNPKMDSSSSINTNIEVCDISNDNDKEQDDNVAQNENNFDGTYKEVGDFYGPHCTIKTGMKTILQPLLEDGISDRILLNQPVIQISYNKNNNPQKHQQIQELGQMNSLYEESLESTPIESDNNHNNIIISTSDGTNIQTECCVVTIPMGCLKRSHGTLFNPSISMDKIDAMRYTKAGTYKKVFLTFTTIFWPTNVPFLGLIRTRNNRQEMRSSTREPMQQQEQNDDNKYDNSEIGSDDPSPIGDILLCDNLWACNGIPCIEAILFGKAGEWAVHKDTNVIQNVVLNFIYDSLGVIDEELRTTLCSDCHITRWEEDPYSCGAYTSMTLGGTELHVHELNRPEYDGSLILSGEATICEYEGSVHAALFSGMNAATKVHEHLNKNK